MSKDKEKIFVTLPEGMLVNHSLFVKDKYDEKSEPKYKVELAYDDPDALDELYDKCIEALEAEFGELPTDDDGDVDENEIVLPILSGDKLTKKREKKGKKGDAYAGKDVIRAGTIYNKHGDDEPGGAVVYDQEVEQIDAVDKGQIYRGCFGCVKVELNTYTEEKTDKPAVSLYLKAFQKTADGDRLGGDNDHSDAFKKVGRKEGGGSSRKKRKG